MKKDVTMKKNSFVNGAMIVTIAIIITKILGILYVIPFHDIIGDEGGALYGYAYTIYLFFVSISTAGIPLAVSRVVSEYQALGYYKTKKRAFLLGKRIALLSGIVFFILITLFAPLLAKFIIGDVVGGSKISDVIFVIRVIGSAILVVPILSIYRGYFEGHRFMSPPSISQVLEQIFRVLVILFGSYIALKVLKGRLSYAVGIALFGASIGAFVSHLYLLHKYHKNKKKFNEKIRSVNEPIVSDKDIIKKLFLYAIPFIMIDVTRSLYNYIDMFSVVKGLVEYAKYSVSDAEIIYSMLSTWGQKFNMILLAISSGIVVSIIPNLTESIVKKNEKEVSNKISLSLNILLYLMIPMSIGISFLSKPIWILFYGQSEFGPKLLSYYIFVGLVIGLFTCLITILQTLKDYKNVLICLIIGVIVKFIMNISLLRTFYSIGLPPYYGIISATILGFFTSIIICMIILHNKYKINFESVLKHFIDILCGSLLMLISLFLVRFIIPISSSIRVVNIIIILIYAIIGAVVYFVYSKYIGLDKLVFGNGNIFSILRRIFIKKKKD